MARLHALSDIAEVAKRRKLLPPGQLLEVRSTEISVDEDLPAWCRMTGNELVSWTKVGRDRSFLVCKGPLAERAALSGGRAPTRALNQHPDLPGVTASPIRCR